MSSIRAGTSSLSKVGMIMKKLSKNSNLKEYPEKLKLMKWVYQQQLLEQGNITQMISNQLKLRMWKNISSKNRTLMPIRVL